MKKLVELTEAEKLERMKKWQLIDLVKDLKRENANLTNRILSFRQDFDSLEVKFFNLTDGLNWRDEEEI